MVGYEITEVPADSTPATRVEYIPHNSLRNPLVEKVLNRAVSIVNSLLVEYGQFVEIHIEMSRTMACTAKQRAKIYKNITTATKNIEDCRQELIAELRKRGKNISYVNTNDMLKYRLYKELEHNDYRTLYSNTPIDLVELIFGKTFEKEHIVPKEMVFSDAFSQLTIEVSDINKKKSNSTAYDYILKEYGKEYLEAYKQRVMKLYDKGAISEQKKNNLLLSANSVTPGAPGRGMAVGGYITKKAKEIFTPVTKRMVVSFPAVTRRLCDDWKLNTALREQVTKQLKPLGLTEELTNRHGEKITYLKPGVWSPEKDHRTFAMQAIIIAFTRPGHINYLNALNTRNIDKDQLLRMRQKYLVKDKDHNWLFRPPVPFDKIGDAVIDKLKVVFVTRQKRYGRVMTTKAMKTANGITRQLIPRGSLHEDTFLGTAKLPANAVMYKVGKTFDKDKILRVSNPKYREALLRRLEEFDGDTIKAFTGKNTLKKNPVWLDDCHLNSVPETVMCNETIYTQRIKVSPDLTEKRINKIIDKKVKKIVMSRFRRYKKNPQAAFNNLEEYPIWLNKKEGIRITHVTIQVNFVATPPIALHTNKAGKPINYVRSGKNSHADIYVDQKGKLRERVVPFFDAVQRTVNGQTITDKDYSGWKYLFTLRRGDYFIVPDSKINLDEIDIEDYRYRAVISRHLFVLAKISMGVYTFRRHNLYHGNNDMNSEINVKSLEKMLGFIKVAVDNIGRIRILNKLAI